MENEKCSFPENALCVCELKCAGDPADAGPRQLRAGGVCVPRVAGAPRVAGPPRRGARAPRLVILVVLQRPVQPPADLVQVVSAVPVHLRSVREDDEGRILRQLGREAAHRALLAFILVPARLPHLVVDIPRAEVDVTVRRAHARELLDQLAGRGRAVCVVEHYDAVVA